MSEPRSPPGSAESARQRGGGQCCCLTDLLEGELVKLWIEVVELEGGACFWCALAGPEPLV